MWNAWYLLLAVGLLAAHGMAGGFGAGGLWEMMNLISFGQGTLGETATFPVSAVKRIKIGPGWPRRGMRLLILPYVAGINGVSKGLCVSFEAPDGMTGRYVGYALHMRSPRDAQTLAGFLGYRPRERARRVWKVSRRSPLNISFPPILAALQRSTALSTSP